jgi:hypothetical protein
MDNGELGLGASGAKGRRAPWKKNGESDVHNCLPQPQKNSDLFQLLYFMLLLFIYFFLALLFFIAFLGVSRFVTRGVQKREEAHYKKCFFFWLRPPPPPPHSPPSVVLVGFFLSRFLDVS